MLNSRMIASCVSEILCGSSHEDTDSRTYTLHHVHDKIDLP